MDNSIVTIKDYLAVLDEKYAMTSLTARFDTPKEWKSDAEKSGAIYLATMDMDGLGTTDRNGEYADGDVDLEWTLYELAHDRNRKFYIDNMDNKETMDLAFGRLADRFMARKVVPEIDAWRIAKYAAGAGTTVSTTITTSANALTAVNVAQRVIFEAETSYAGSYFLCDFTFYNLIKESITFERLPNGQGINREVPFLDGMEVVIMPEIRFHTAITLLDGTTEGETAGGYTAAGKLIQFMIIDPDSVVQATSHEMARFWAPNGALKASSGADGVTEKRDAWSFDYRLYDDAFVEGNKSEGIYVQTVT